MNVENSIQQISGPFTPHYFSNIPSSWLPDELEEDREGLHDIIEE